MGVASAVNKKQTAETVEEHLTACSIVQFEERVTNEFRWLALWNLRRREGDRLPGSGIAFLMRGAHSDD